MHRCRMQALTADQQADAAAGMAEARANAAAAEHDAPDAPVVHALRAASRAAMLEHEVQECMLQHSSDLPPFEAAASAAAVERDTAAQLLSPDQLVEFQQYLADAEAANLAHDRFAAVERADAEVQRLAALADGHGPPAWQHPDSVRHDEEERKWQAARQQRYDMSYQHGGDTSFRPDVAAVQARLEQLQQARSGRLQRGGDVVMTDTSDVIDTDMVDAEGAGGQSDAMASDDEDELLHSDDDMEHSVDRQQETQLRSERCARRDAQRSARGAGMHPIEAANEHVRLLAEIAVPTKRRPPRKQAAKGSNKLAMRKQAAKSASKPGVARNQHSSAGKGRSALANVPAFLKKK